MIYNKNMKENKYDDIKFFEKYSQMERSKRGLEAAGEWGTLKNMLPSFKNKSVLDLGCGYGWHCIHAMEQGAKNVVGVDISEKMLAVARQKTTFKNIEYQQVAIEDINFNENTFDVIISSLTLHYIENFENLIKKIAKILKSGGEFIFSVEHPIFTSNGSQDWAYNKNGDIAHFPVDNYFYEGARKANFLGENVIKYHKTLTTYLNTLLENGFNILAIKEPKPSNLMIKNNEDMKNELRRPMMLIIKAKYIFS